MLGDRFFESFFVQFSYYMNYMNMGMGEIQLPMLYIDEKSYARAGTSIINTSVGIVNREVFNLTIQILYLGISGTAVVLWLTMVCSTSDEKKRISTQIA